MSATAIFIIALAVAIVWPAFGAYVWVLLDRKRDGELYLWYREDPTGGLLCYLVLCAWPFGLVLRWRGVL